jgi:preprotein translocase subunit SecG
MGALLLVKSTIYVLLIYKLTYFVNHRNRSRELVEGSPTASRASYTPLLMYTVLAVLQVFISGMLIFLILLHSGKDAGLSGAFGIGGGGSSFGGGSMVERNLDRATVFFAILFVVNTVVLLKI